MTVLLKDIENMLSGCHLKNKINMNTNHASYRPTPGGLEKWGEIKG